jgi:CheY-like chemotaxis protein
MPLRGPCARIPVTLRVIALTGYGRPEVRERTVAAGFDAHLMSPVNLQALRRMLQ